MVRGHEVPAQPGHCVQGFVVEAACRAQRWKFTVAVPSVGMGIDAKILEDLERSDRHGANGRLGNLCFSKPFVVPVSLRLGKGGMRIDQVRKALAVFLAGHPIEDAIGVRQYVPHFWEGTGQIAKHAGIL